MADPLLDLISGNAQPQQAASATDPLLSLIQPVGVPAAQDAKTASVQAGAAVNSSLNSIPRQLGLTARYGLEGLANGAQILTEPIRYLTDRLTGQTGKTVPLGVLASQAADAIGLPKPEGANERTIGDATRMLAGTAGTMGAGGLASNAPGAIGKVATILASNPAVQLSSAAGSGLLGGASREAGGSPLDQVGASVIGGVVGGGVPSLISSGTNLAKSLLKPSLSQPQLDAKITAVLGNSGIDYSQVPEKIKQSMRADLVSALSTGKDISSDAAARLLDFRTSGLTPTRGAITLDPVQITKEQNLAKMAANSSDAGLHSLPVIQNQNNTQLINGLNQAGASTGNINNAGNVLTSSILGRQSALREAEQSAWDAAKSSPGYTQPISSSVISDINGALGDEGMMPFMNPTISKYMESFQTGQSFTPQAYRNLQSMLTKEVAKGGNEGYAAGLARRTLEQSDLQPVRFANTENALVTPGMANSMQAADSNATNAIYAVNQARAATKQAYTFEDSNPLVRSVLSDSASSDPQRIAQRFIIGGTAQEAQDVANQVGPQGQQVIKSALVNYLKNKALNGASDEVGKFSQSSYNKALSDLDNNGKLQIFFSPDEVTQLKAMGRAASYAQAQPVGSAVNNSNSGALVLGKGYDFLKSAAGKIPGGKAFVVDPLQNIELSMKQKQAANVLPGLLADQPKKPVSGMLAPAMYLGGLLAAP